MTNLTEKVLAAVAHSKLGEKEIISLLQNVAAVKAPQSKGEQPQEPKTKRRPYQRRDMVAES